MIGIGTAGSLPVAEQDATLARGAEPHMTTSYYPVSTDDGAASDGSQTVMVPLNRKALVPMAAERVRRLRKHLVESLRGERELKRPERSASPVRPEPEGFVGLVARTACTLCKGWCCKGGEEHAYLDERTMARVRRARPELDARAVLRLYSERVLPASYQDSCVFHGPEGCTLDRALRSDLCNSYFCNGLGHFVKRADSAARVVVMAGGEEIRPSPVLTRSLERPSRLQA
jgi:hypothetical protein